MAVAFMGDNSSWRSKYSSTRGKSAASGVRGGGDVEQAASIAAANITSGFFIAEWYQAGPHAIPGKWRTSAGALPDTNRESLSPAKVLGAARPKPYPTHPRMPPTIIIADDHPLFREALKLAISQALVGARTLEADTVDSLLATLNANPEVDLLLLDLGMPGAHGFSALVQARAHYPSVPVVVISGREDQDIAQRTLTHGASAFIAKSASVPTIIYALQTILRGDVWTPPAQHSTAGARVHPDEAD